MSKLDLSKIDQSSELSRIDAKKDLSDGEVPVGTSTDEKPVLGNTSKSGAGQGLRKSSKGLGKQFGSLMPDNFDDSILVDKKDRVKNVLISEVIPNPGQPRKEFDPELIKELSLSIKQYGILQPLIVTPEDGKYVIIAGERRYRAANLAGLEYLPALVRSSEELERLEIGLIENVQRVDLSPLDQAISIGRLNEQFNIDYKEIAKRLGKAHTSILNTVRLLQLTEEGKEALRKEQITEGHAKALLAIKDNPELLNSILDKTIKSKLSVRQTESLLRQTTTEKKIKDSKKTNTDYKAQLKPLEKIFGAKVSIANKSRGKGMITISFQSKKELEQIIDQLTKYK
ncbi:MAG: ParB/RepB/Spo0J family partition protein [Patescibacteria group bacterium]